MTGKELCDYIKQNELEDFTLEISIYEGPSKGRIPWPNYRHFENIELGDIGYSDKVFLLDVDYREDPYPLSISNKEEE